ncbi:MAG: peptidoglycan DD-metalloendopeptidase family protein, partial [Nitrosopumilaceae archaeon]|nr:M23 family metallopeptidase [Nitrosopumilaceae archaeon]NIX60408.1 peptidoglycan DD-metalloendopeptidase family protein [Nitrosopumilaceae archaeon]
MGSGSVQWRLSGLFMEFRNTGSFDHFHDGIDITDVPAPTGELVFPVDNGTVETIYYGGDNSYVSITHSQGTGRTVYLHIDPNDNLTSGQPVSVGTLLGSVRDIAGPGDHLHFNEGFNYAEVNPLQSGHIAPFDDER